MLKKSTKFHFTALISLMLFMLATSLLLHVPGTVSADDAATATPGEVVAAPPPEVIPTEVPVEVIDPAESAPESTTIPPTDSPVQPTEQTLEIAASPTEAI